MTIGAHGTRALIRECLEAPLGDGPSHTVRSFPASVTRSFELADGEHTVRSEPFGQYRLADWKIHYETLLIGIFDDSAVVDQLVFSGWYGTRYVRWFRCVQRRPVCFDCALKS